MPSISDASHTARQAIQASIAAKQALLEDAVLLSKIEQAAQMLLQTYQSGGKVLLCGNGGSAADAQHIAAELSGRFYFDRPPLYAEALHVNTSYLTAVANDYGYNEVFARMVEAAGRPGDVLIAISTSGNSPSVLRAVQKAVEVGMSVIGLTGASGGKLATCCPLCLQVPSSDTPRIQECHILIGHIWCEVLEKGLFQPPAEKCN
ncbi:MAG: D-sedoheptulose 7-phosphate isomerase [Saprospiraceae bacterium]|nr:D-sedoheptulose 7-phosphate isomerase [Saprospiraceae bacterium]MDW8228989.1 D-sedoheptulose 7-phosphate isomerase [Saprospiraceae bacterium]